MGYIAIGFAGVVVGVSYAAVVISVGVIQKLCKALGNARVYFVLLLFSIIGAMFFTRFANGSDAIQLPCAFCVIAALLTGVYFGMMVAGIIELIGMMRNMKKILGDGKGKYIFLSAALGKAIFSAIDLWGKL